MGPSAREGIATAICLALILATVIAIEPQVGSRLRMLLDGLSAGHGSLLLDPMAALGASALQFGRAIGVAQEALLLVLTIVAGLLAISLMRM